MGTWCSSSNQVAFRVLAGDARPHFTTVNTFRKNHRDAISALFLGVLLICQEAGLVGLGHVAVDRTKNRPFVLRGIDAVRADWLLLAPRLYRATMAAQPA